jgi:signal transduction histidine kinase
MTSDVQLGKNAGCGSVLVRTGRGGDDGICEAVADITSDSLTDAAARILEMEPVKVEVGAVARLHETESEVIQAIGRFGGDIGHDFNNIFGSSLACVDLIRQRVADYDKSAEVEDILAILERAAQSGVALSNRIRGLARPGEIKKTAVSLLGCINSVVELLAQTKKNTCEFEVVCPEDITVEVADFTVTQTVLQLCENSLDAMRHLSERFILFGVDRVAVTDTKNNLSLSPGEYAVLSISDHGKGITAPRQGEVFHPFSSLKGRTVGKGLGLSMASAATVMKQHGGTLALASTPDIGTTLRLYFPLNMQKSL